jgi:YVTN family beta-propeller protein
MTRPKSQARTVTPAAAPWSRTLSIALAFACSFAAGVRPAAAQVRGPGQLAIERESGNLLVLCEKSGSLARLDGRTGRVLVEVALGDGLCAVGEHPDGRRLYATCRSGQEVVELDASSLAVLRRLPLRGDPTGIEVSGDGARLFVALHSLDEVVLIDLAAWREVRRASVGNGPGMLRRDPRGGRVLVGNLLPDPGPPDEPCRLELTVLDERDGGVRERVALDGANVGRHFAFAPDGTLFLALTRPKNLVPMTQVARGFVVTNGLAVVAPGSGAPPVQLLLDLPNRSHADPYGLVLTPDGTTLYVSASGTDEVLAVDVGKLLLVRDACAAGRIPHFAEHLGLSRQYVRARIAVGANPRGMAVSPDGRRVFVANRLDDSVSVIDTASDRVESTWSLGEPGAEGSLVRGERLFNSAARTFQRQFSCATCHPDDGLDGLRYDLEPDGLGANLVDNRNLRGVRDTAPFKWAGTNPDVETQCGVRTAKWIVRTAWLRPSEVVALADYVRSIPPVQNPHLAADGRLTAAQERGKALFERAVTHSGAPIPTRDRCHTCHSGPDFTDFRRFDVGTRAPSDTTLEFDTAHLTNVFESPPYLHDGRAATLADVVTRHNREDRHGVTSDLLPDEVADLVEYMLALGPPRAAAPGPPDSPRSDGR